LTPETNKIVIVRSAKGINCYFSINFQNKVPVPGLLIRKKTGTDDEVPALID